MHLAQGAAASRDGTGTIVLANGGETLVTSSRRPIDLHRFDSPALVVSAVVFVCTDFSSWFFLSLDNVEHFVAVVAVNGHAVRVVAPTLGVRVLVIVLHDQTIPSFDKQPTIFTILY